MADLGQNQTGSVPLGQTQCCCYYRPERWLFSPSLETAAARLSYRSGYTGTPRSSGSPAGLTCQTKHTHFNSTSGVRSRLTSTDQGLQNILIQLNRLLVRPAGVICVVQTGQSNWWGSEHKQQSNSIQLDKYWFSHLHCSSTRNTNALFIKNKSALLHDHLLCKALSKFSK